MNKTLFIIIVIAVAVLVLLNVGLDQSRKASTQQTTENVNAIADAGEVKTKGEAAIGGKFTLMNTAGEEVTEAALQENYSLVFFGFTNCPAICPTGLTTVTNVMEALNSPDNLQGVFITVDVERDTQEVIKAYLENFHPNMIGLTGSEKQLKTAQEAYKVYAKKMDTPMGVMYDHSAFIYLMGPDGKYITHFRHNQATEEVVAKLNEVMG